MLNIRQTFSPLNAADLEEVEREFSFKFPKEIFAFYLRSNGGRPENDRFVDGEEMFVIDEFLPIKYGPERLTLESTVRRVKHLLPEYFVPIAVGPFGDFFCFTTRHSEVGAIYILPLEGRPNSSRTLAHLANSFDEFTQKLISKHEYDRRRTVKNVSRAVDSTDNA